MSNNPEQSAASEPEDTNAQPTAEESSEAEASIDISSSPDDPGSLEDQVRVMHASLQDAEQRVLRAQAELENFRKRSRREMEDERRYAAAPLVTDLLSVLDNLNRALSSAGEGASGGLVDGVKLVVTLFESVLQKHHCERIPAVGAAFDPNLHEAIGQQPSEEHPAGTVMLETQVGYRLHDRVIRPTQVFVSTGPPTS